MEVVVSGAVGALSGFCAYGLLGFGLSAVGAGSARRGHGALKVLSEASSWLGSLLPERLAHDPRIVRAARELARSPGFRRVPLDGSADAVLGLLALSSIAAAGVGAVISLSLPGLIAGAALPGGYAAARAARGRSEERRRVEEAMPEAFGALAMSLGSGRSLAQAMRFVGSHAEEPVRTEFMHVSFSIACGIPAAAALDEMLGRLSAPGLDLVALALKVSQRTGAPLAGLLEQASEMVGERIELKRRLDVKTSQARMSARMVAVMPIAMIGILALLSPDFQAGLASAPGAASVALALTLDALAWASIRKIMEVEL